MAQSDSPGSAVIAALARYAAFTRRLYRVWFTGTMHTFDTLPVCFGRRRMPRRRPPSRCDSKPARSSPPGEGAFCWPWPHGRRRRRRELLQASFARLDATQSFVGNDQQVADRQDQAHRFQLVQNVMRDRVRRPNSDLPQDAHFASGQFCGCFRQLNKLPHSGGMFRPIWVEIVSTLRRRGQRSIDLGISKTRHRNRNEECRFSS
jgi:hypothetical protein